MKKSLTSPDTCPNVFGNESRDFRRPDGAAREDRATCPPRQEEDLHGDGLGVLIP
jgi:hypothetical protein